MDNGPNRVPSSSELYGGVAAAVFAVVFAAFVVGCAWMLISFGVPRNVDDASTVFWIGFMAAFVTFPFSAVSALVVGAPLFWLCNRFGFTSILQFLLAGFIMSCLLGAAVAVGHYFAGFLTGGFDFGLALSIVAVGGPVAALTVRWAAGFTGKHFD